MYWSDVWVTVNSVFLIWHPDFQGTDKLKERNENTVSFRALLLMPRGQPWLESSYNLSQIIVQSKCRTLFFLVFFFDHCIHVCDSLHTLHLNSLGVCHFFNINLVQWYSQRILHFLWQSHIGQMKWCGCCKAESPLLLLDWPKEVINIGTAFGCFLIPHCC